MMKDRGQPRFTRTDSTESQLVGGLVRDRSGACVRVVGDPRGAQRARDRARNEINVAQALQLDAVLQPLSIHDVPQGAQLVFDDIQATSLMDLGPLATDLGAFYDIAIQATQILRRIHDAGWVHRGLDPRLVLRRDDGKVVFTGLDRATRRATEAVAVVDPSSVGLALPYIAPEQTARMHRSVDERADLYALGVILYEVLTGWLPLEADDALAWIHAHLAKRPIAAHVRHRKVPEPLSALLSRTLEKNPEDRYQSAVGLLTDLERQAASLRTTGVVQPHALGASDHMARFHIPETLFGRKREVAELEAGLDRTCEGRAQAVMVSGHPGIGKSRLITEIQRSLARRSGYLATGKADQYRRDIPFAMMKQAFTELVLDVLTESSRRLSQWRERLEAELDGLGQVMIDALPELRSVLGDQPEVPALPPRESRARLTRAFQCFIRAFAAQDHPLVLFLDDLQWIDPASLTLLHELLASPDGLYLYVIGAYRDNEVHADHPLTAALQALDDSGLRVQHVTLGPLPTPALTELVQAVVGDHSDTLPLAELVLQKTGANPFFVGRFLESLHVDGLISWDATRTRWAWDLAAIAQADLTDNVVDLMAARAQRLASTSRQVLTYGAAIGSTFAVRQVARVLGMSLSDIGEALLPAVEDGLVALIGGDFPLSDDDDRPLRVAFAHDRIQEATYSLISADERTSLHRGIVQLLDNTDEDLTFEVAHHWSRAMDAPLTDHERQQATAAYLRATERALSAGAFEPALSYAKAGAELLGDGGWQSQHSLCVALHVRWAEAAFANGRTDLAYDLGRIVLERAEHTMDKIRVHELRILHDTSVTMRMAEAVTEMLQVMQLLGTTIEPAQSMEDLGALVGRALGAFGTMTDEQILDLPAMQSPEHVAAQRVLASSLPAASMAMPMIHVPAMVTGLEMAVQQGLSGHACTSMAHLAMILCATGHYELGYRFGCLATKVADRFPESHVTDNEIVFPIFVQHWIEPMAQVAIRLEKASRDTFDLGHMGSFGHAINSAFLAKLQSGQDFDSLLELSPRWIASAAGAKQDIAVVSLTQWAQQLHCMRGDAPEQSTLSGELYDSSVMLPFLIDNGVGPAILYDTLASCELAWRFGDPERVLEICASRWSLVDTPGNGGIYSYVLVTTLRCLAQLALVQEVSDETRSIMEEVHTHRARLAGWAKLAPANHASRHALIEAEVARVEGRESDAGSGYDEAIRLARLHGLSADAGTAAERAAAHYLAGARDICARAYALEAVSSWDELGATAVATHVRRTYDRVLSNDRAARENFDVQALLWASEAMSGEPALDRLLDKLVGIVTAVAGAQRAVLALDRDGMLVVEATGSGEAGEASVMIGAPADDWPDAPAEVLNYVHRTGTTVLLHDPVNEGRFVDAPFVKRAKPRSILAISLEHQGVRTGVLYLENNLTNHAFTGDRVRLLQALSSQAATSIENARLVGDLQRHTIELARKNEQLTELDRLRDEFLAKTSHELRTPLHGIMGLAQSMLDGANVQSDANSHNLGLIVASGRRLTNLVNDILDLSTLKQRDLVLRQRAMNLHDVTSLVVALTQTMVDHSQVTVRNAVPANAPAVMADSERIEQVLLNLVGNAVKFTTSGTIEVGVDVPDDGRVRVWVSDTGIGISDDAKLRIFTAFEQANSDITNNYGGAGLGLSVAQELVQLHGSSLTVQSEVGRGSTFSFLLPITDQAVDRTPSQVRTVRGPEPTVSQFVRNEASGNGFHVLVVDDEPVNLQVLDNYLGQHGYRVTTATRGEHALQLLHDGLAPDVVLLDVMMPGMDGFEVCRRLRKMQGPSDLPVVMVTARTRTHDVVQGLDAGANDYVTKPFSSAEVSARIHTHVQLSHMHTAVGRFVPRSFLDLLGRGSIVDVRLGDSIEREMSVLYADIRAFRTLSKDMDPSENFTFINAYLGAMEPVVTSCGGFIDKYVGDGIMALFEKAEDAVRAGVQMHRALERFNQARQSAHQMPVRIGVGVHTGRLMLGTVGGKLRMDTTVISDAVALTYRIEGMTKRFGNGMIITSATHAGLPEGAFKTRVLDRLGQSDGDNELYDVYETADASVRAARSASQPTFEQGVRLFHAREFDAAAQLFAVVEAMDPYDRAVRVYVERCQTILRQFTPI